MANPRPQSAQPTKIKFSDSPKRFPIIFALIIAAAAIGIYLGSNHGNNNVNTNTQSSGSDSFAGEWVTQSPGTYYLRNDDGSRYGEITANFDITVRKVGSKGYTCGGSMNVVSKQEYGELSVMILQGDNPLQFNSAYTDDITQVSGNKLTSEHRGMGPYGRQIIALDLVKADAKSGGKDTLYATMSVIPEGNSAGGDETDIPIVLVRK